MSSFIVDRDVIDTIITAMIDYAAIPGLTQTAGDEIGRKLWTWNVRAVAYRYPRDVDGQRPGPIGFRDRDAHNYTWTRRTTSPAEVVDALDSLAYQCDEPPEWETAPERALILSLRAAAATRAAEIEEQARAIQSATPTVHYDTKQTAAAIRKALHAQWPGVRFSVRMARGTAYGWLNVDWTDGPTERAVEDITGGFQSSRFDGTDDAYHQVEPDLYMVDGVPTIIRYSCCGVLCQRTLSDQARAWARPQVTADPQRWAYGHDYGDDEWSVSQRTHRLLASVDLTAGFPATA